MNHFSFLSVWRDHGNWVRAYLKKWRKPWQRNGIRLYRPAAEKPGGAGLGTNLNRIHAWGVWFCFNWNEMKMSIFMDPFNFCDLESFLFYVWKLREALRNKALVFFSFFTVLKSLLRNTKGTPTQGLGRRAEPSIDDRSTISNSESHHKLKRISSKNGTFRQFN